MTLPDNETRVDLLNNEAIASTIVAILRAQHVQPVTIGVHGDWGAGNPRQIKRFLNSLLLREQTAEARGFGADVKLPVLAKLMLAERFMPRMFDQIAFAAAA